MRRSVHAYLVLLVALATACAPNPYAKFYQGIPSASALPGYEAAATPLEVYSTQDFLRDGRELMRRGYMPVGQSAFNAGMSSVKPAQLQAHATRIGAQVVLVASRYTNTVQGAIPLTVPSTTTSTTSGTARVYGTGGSATVTGTGTTTTTGTRTMMMPYAVNRGDFAALYFVRVRPRLGLMVQPLDDATRRAIQSNAGVMVDIVIEGTPAFDADILPGDVLVSFDSQRVGSVQGFNEIIPTLAGKSVVIHLVREGQAITKTVTLRP